MDFIQFILQDGRLQSGDHILQIGEVSLRGMGSEQVAAVLRQSGTQVRLVVARPFEPSSPDYQVLSIFMIFFSVLLSLSFIHHGMLMELKVLYPTQNVPP